MTKVTQTKDMGLLHWPPSGQANVVTWPRWWPLIFVFWPFYITKNRALKNCPFVRFYRRGSYVSHGHHHLIWPSIGLRLGQLQSFRKRLHSQLGSLDAKFGLKYEFLTEMIKGQRQRLRFTTCLKWPHVICVYKCCIYGHWREVPHSTLLAICM